MPEIKELTGPQVVAAAVFDRELNITKPATYSTYRTIRLDPTIAFVRAVRLAIVAAGEWSIEADDDVDDVMVEYARNTLLPQRELIYENAMAGNVDYGWAPFEKVFAIGDDGKVVLAKLKPLLHDLTTILASNESGAFIGFKQESIDGKTVWLPLENSFLIPFRAEGTNWYGNGLLENARKTMVRYDNTDKAAARYDRKVAGAMITVYYPEGETRNAQGVMTPNNEIAQAIGTNAQSSGVMIIPHVVLEKIGEAEHEEVRRWIVEMLSDTAATQTQFVQRMEYLDAQKARAMFMAERSVLEGKYGTKAEAGEHMGAVVTVLEGEDRLVTRHVNWYILDQLLTLNWGEQARGKVRFAAAPLRDERLALIEQVYQTILKNPGGFVEEFAMLDTDAMKDRLGLPKSAEVADALDVDEGELDDDESKRVTDVAGAPGEAT
jgi:hypothetical protein